jgi:hypothetical protein
MTHDQVKTSSALQKIGMLTASIDSIHISMFLTDRRAITALDDNESTDVLSFLSFVRFTKSVAWRDILAFYYRP